jgi:hypothetical protein|tara:strand:- start:633 stop:824 length:192 start_codon:yes stop_codon:yes gene_type:complete
MEAVLIDDLVKALEALLAMPDYDGSAETSRARQRIKNRAKKLLKEYKDDRLAKVHNMSKEPAD